MKLGELNGCEFHIPTSGGKAGKGFQVSSTIQVRRGNQILKQFRFIVADPASRTAAATKAKTFARNQ